MNILVLTTTLGTEADARRLARALIERRLAACVQIDRLESHYRWEGVVTAEPEWRLTVKTLPAQLDALRAFFAAEHPYQLPQLVWHELTASEDYGRWVTGEVGRS